MLVSRSLAMYRYAVSVSIATAPLNVFPSNGKKCTLMRGHSIYRNYHVMPMMIPTLYTQLHNTVYPGNESLINHHAADQWSINTHP